MYFIVYRYVLKSGKNFEQVAQWMRKHEAIQARWGAVEADYYRLAGRPGTTFFARYKVKSVDRWCQSLNTPEADTMLTELGLLIESSEIKTWIFEELPY